MDLAVLFGVFFILMFLGAPVAFSLLASSVSYLLLNDISLTVAVQRLTASISDSFPILACPFFIFAGCVMNNGGVTEKIFGFCRKLVGHITGGLGHANILASVIFAGMSGSAVADAGGLGQIELKAMREAGYDDDFSLAVTAGSSLVGPLIPPSVPAVMFGVLGGVSVGRLFIAGVIPGLLIASGMAILVVIQCKKKNYPRDPRASLTEIWASFKGAFLPILTPVIIIGGILTGVFTPTEAAVIVVVYALILSLLSRNIKLREIPEFLRESVRNVCSTMIILSTSSIFAWILTTEQVPQNVAKFLLEHFSSPIIILFIINALLLIVGTFMETIPAMTILVPVFMPVVLKLGIDPIHFGLMMILNLVAGLLTPPLGMVLYVLSSVSGVRVERIVKAVIPYFCVALIVLVIITLIPSIVTFLPNLLFGT
ncbi:MAG: TRAP transporter large permease [Holosporales bacterium]|jgi:tripartite ATP-independent transporter DctM subunit|nr:TRAP transporter large permease [Holosporales bacterium]